MKLVRHSGSWGAAGEEWVWVTRCFGLGAADASIVFSFQLSAVSQSAVR